MEQKEGLQNYYNKCTKQIEDIVELVRGQLTLMARITLGALIVIDVHGKEMLFYRLHFPRRDAIGRTKRDCTFYHRTLRTIHSQ